jgi:hypothetical protein
MLIIPLGLVGYEVLEKRVRGFRHETLLKFVFGTIPIAGSLILYFIARQNDLLSALKELLS